MFRLRSSTVLYNLNEGQVKKIKTVLTQLPEDLQYDYHRDIVSLARSPDEYCHRGCVIIGCARFASREILCF